MLESPIHSHQLLRYSVEIINAPTIKSEQTALVSFYDENNKRVSTHKFGVISLDQIFSWIENGETINLNSAYIKNFSLNDYRVMKGMDDQAPVRLLNFSARKTFFDCETHTDFSHAVFEGEKTVFESAIFANGYVNFYSVDFGNGDVNFKKAKFGSGSTTFQSAKFGEGTTSFYNANFGTGNLSFIDANFNKGDVDYRNTYFGDGTVDFKFAKFSSGDVAFQRASFGKGKKDFKNVEFGGGKIDFRRVDFNDGDISFGGVEFGDGRVTFRSASFGDGYKDFSMADFGNGEAQFEFVNFGTGTVSFNRSNVKHISLNSCPLNCYVDLRFGICESIDLSYTVVRDIIDVEPIGEKVVIKEMNLVDMRILGRLFINWRENNVHDLIYSQAGTSLFQKAEQFRVLKENFRNNGQYEDEDASYLEFKRCEARAILEESIELKGSKRVLAYPVFIFKKIVFDQVGRYATAPMRVLMNAVVVVFVFGFVYDLFTRFYPKIGRIGTTLPDDLNFITELSNSVYYSAITFFTIGYGDYFAIGFLKILAAIEGFVGVFMMSYFTVAFVRKILR